MNDNCLRVDEVNKILYVGTTEQGLMSLNLEQITGFNTLRNQNIKDFQLYNNYPNPFNQCTIINYQLSMKGMVKLEIYNTLGQLINTLVDEEKNPGTYKVQWNGKDFKGRDVSSGLYFYRLTAGKFSEVKKMLMIR